MAEEYPDRLIPKPGYKQKMQREDLGGCGLHLQRRCDPAKVFLSVGDGPAVVTPAAFGEVGLAGMSVNILGGLAEIEDIRWRQTEGAMEPWDGRKVEISDFNGCYHLTDAGGAVYFQYDDADGMTWQFPRQFPEKATFDKFKDAIVGELGQFSKKTEYTLNAHAECHHAPCNLNFWHVEVRSFIDSKPLVEIEGSKSAYQKKALRGMVESLRVKATYTPPDYVAKIPSDIYMSDLTADTEAAEDRLPSGDD